VTADDASASTYQGLARLSDGTQAIKVDHDPRAILAVERPRTRGLRGASTRYRPAARAQRGLLDLGVGRQGTR